MIVFIKDKQVELKDENKVAQTFQVNNIINLSNREATTSNSIYLLKTATNIKALNFLSLANNNSNLPYEKIEASIYSDNGESIIYKGWCTITETSNEYKLTIVSGIVDFFKKIEKTNLSQIGISDLDHIKTLSTVIDSWTAGLNYKYIIADYNGKNELPNLSMNIDYQIPSVKVSYLFQKIMEFTGNVAYGNFLTHVDFTNFWLTYPKPIGTSTPIVSLINSEVMDIDVDFVYNGFTGEYTTIVFPIFFNDNFVSSDASLLSSNIILFNVSSNYRLKAEGFHTESGNIQYGNLEWKIIRASGSLNLSPISGDLNGLVNETAIISIDSGDKLILTVSFNIANYNSFPNFATTLERIIGYQVGFADTFIDFTVKDFIKEILQRFSLTMISNKYTNAIEFLSLSEIIRNVKVNDWSKKFQKKLSEKYTIGSYAKKNNFKYVYNEQNETHNNGFIEISNENLKEEFTAIQSKIYSPEKKLKIVVGNQLHTYKIWDKNIKDDASVEYKDLEKRFYFLRETQNNQLVTFSSELLGTSQSVTTFPVESYVNLPFNQIIERHYKDISSIFDKAKIIKVSLFLNDNDVANFTFKNTIYIEQLGSYFIVNSIPNYIKGKSTNVELLEVDRLLQIATPINIGTFINIVNITQTVCDINIEFLTDITFPFFIQVQGYIPDIVTGLIATFDSFVLVNSNNVIVTLPQGGNWFIKLIYNDIFSSYFNFNNSLSCIIDIPTVGSLIITSLQTLSIVNNVRQIKVNFTTDAVIPIPILNGNWSYTIDFLPFTQIFNNVNDNFIIINTINSNEFLGVNNTRVSLSIGALISNTVISNG